MKLLTSADSRLATMLDHPADEVLIDPTWWSWSGAHGGLAVALAAAAMRRAAGEDVELRSVTAQLLAPIDGPARFAAQVVRQGRSVVATSGTAVQDDRPRLTATAVFGRPSRGPVASAPGAPASPPVEGLDRFAVPLDVLPFAAHTEVRPVGENRPFAGGTTAELTAWIRFLDDDRPVDELRAVVLMDCLAPSIAAVLPAMAAVPTVELSVHLAPAVRTATSPWVLLHARTDLAVGDGWVSERLDAWAPDGTHLASATQLRLVLS
jgi:acyl-CoA thioesterase